MHMLMFARKVAHKLYELQGLVQDVCFVHASCPYNTSLHVSLSIFVTSCQEFCQVDFFLIELMSVFFCLLLILFLFCIQL